MAIDSLLAVAVLCFQGGTGQQLFILLQLHGTVDVIANLAYGLYSVTLALTENRPLTFWESFINGVFAAAVLYIKFTMMGFYGALAVFVIFWYCTRPSHLKKLLSTIGGFIAGIVALSLPVFAYFALNGAVDDFITVYFHNNLFLYPAEFEGTRRDMIVTCLEKTLTLLLAAEEE
jgi:multisubunit Na+/H+ antiporter MnhB subunit